MSKQMEKVPIFLIFKDGDSWKTETGDGVSDWELLGFLTALAEDLRQKMVEELSPRTDNERLI